MKQLLIATCLLLLALTAPLSGIVIAGRQATEPHLQALRSAFDFAKCAQPCWHGIQFGTTTPDEAMTILSSGPNVAITNSDEQEKGCAYSWTISVETTTWQGHICNNENRPITDFILRNSLAGNTFRLLDAIMIFGKPYDIDCNIVLPFGEPGFLSLWVSFKNHISVIAKRKLPYDGLIFDPSMPITELDYRPLDNLRTAFVNPWLGFTPQRLDSKAVYFNSTCPIIQQ